MTISAHFCSPTFALIITFQ